MKTLLLVAHGSRLVTSNAAVQALTVKLHEKMLASGFSAIEHAFLELTEPTIPEGIAKLVSTGAKEVVVLPYFLAPGTHVVDDLPVLIKQAEQRYTDVRFTVTQHLGAVEGMIDLILNSAESAA